MGRVFLLLTSDSHTNSTLGLCSPEARLPEGQQVSLSRAQEWLWQSFETDYLGVVRKRLRRRDRIYGIHAGDGPDMNVRTTQLMTQNPTGAISLFVDTMRPLRELCRDGFWMLRGTDAHGGDAGNLEEAAALMLHTTRYPADSPLASCWHLRLMLAGTRIDATHHGPAGRLPWTGPNGLQRAAYEILAEAVRNGEPPPHLKVQAHNHVYYDTHENAPVRVVGLPCWQISTSYGWKVQPNRGTDIGAVLVVLDDDGRMDVEPFLFRHKLEARWSNDNENASI